MLAPLAMDDDTLLGATLASGDDTPPQGSPSTPMHRVGRFELLERLGAGGMGVVYAARDDRLDRKVALKLLATDAASEIARARLVREAQAMARLEHPNIATVHEVGNHNGSVFVAMELVDGPSLEDWLTNEHDWAERLRMLVRAGEGLAAAHGEQLVHRDFKPANVMIGSDGRPRVLDFGLVRAQRDPAPGPAPTPAPTPDASSSASAALDSPLTVAGAIMGTPAYMAPEQLSGALVDHRSDQFSFCVTLYEALYGERPFHGKTLGALLESRGHAPSFPERSSVPSTVAKIIARGLQPDPDARWPSMQELLAALERQLQRHADPERDLAVGRRQRALLIAALLAIMTVTVLIMRRFDPAIVLGEPRRALGFYSFQCCVALLIVLATRRSVGRNLINRQLLELILVYAGALWLNRLIALPLALAWPEVYLLDLGSLCTLCLLSGTFIHRWLYTLAGFAGLCLGAGCLAPEYAPQASFVSNAGSLLSLIIVWRGGARDQQQAEAAMRAHTRTRPGRSSSNHAV